MARLFALLAALALLVAAPAHGYMAEKPMYTEMMPEPECMTVFEAAKATPELSTLALALETLGLDAVFNESYVGTFFAPTDAAFGAALAALDLSAEQLLASDLLPTVLGYHVVEGVAAFSFNLTDGMVLPTLLGDEDVLELMIDESVVVLTELNNATVIIPDVEACESVVHVIDEVLLPKAAEVLLPPLAVSGRRR